jgi:hypothetical protein
MQSSYSKLAWFFAIGGLYCFLVLGSRIDTDEEMQLKYFCAYCHPFLWSGAFACWRIAKLNQSISSSRSGTKKKVNHQSNIAIGSVLVLLSAALVSLLFIKMELSRIISPEEYKAIQKELNLK